MKSQTEHKITKQRQNEYVKTKLSDRRLRGRNPKGWGKSWYYFKLIFVHLKENKIERSKPSLECNLK